MAWFKFKTLLVATKVLATLNALDPPIPRLNLLNLNLLETRVAQCFLDSTPSP